jgi:glycosyltransferase involved in cell wall biosynthesis
MNELITVIINVYNGEKFIKKCIDSIINQTYNNLEILIINDGSTDSTLDICKTYKDKRIKVITTKNQGLSLSRNTGIDNAKGEYLYFIDADDFIELDTIEYLYKLLINNNASMATCKCIDIYNYEFDKKDYKEEIEINDGIHFLKKILLSIDRSVTTWNKLMKKELFNNIRYENRITNDVVVTYKQALKIDKYVFSNQIKYYHYRHKESITGIHSAERAIDQYKASYERYNYIKKIYPNFLENDIAMLNATVMCYNHNYKSVDDFLKQENARKLFKNIFSLKKVLKCNLKKIGKIKIILYRINPKLERIIQNIYIKEHKK